MNILLVEPNFPISPKSKNHKNFLPIGLLKIASYLRSKGEKVKLVRGIPKNLLNINILSFKPDEIWITSLFTYWANYVKDTVKYYKRAFPHAKIKVGGVYASLMPKHCKEFTGCDEVHKGIIKEAEEFFPAYDLIENVNTNQIDYQIIHASRGCIRKCPFCGTWKIEPKFEPKKSIKSEIKFKKIIFYDNNFLANPYIENILTELIDLTYSSSCSLLSIELITTTTFILPQPRPHSECIAFFISSCLPTNSSNLFLALMSPSSWELIHSTIKILS